MVFGTLYTFPFDHPRTIGIKAAAKASNIELDFVPIQQVRTPDHLAVHKLGKVPAFVGEDGFKLIECMAIATYITKQDKNTTLLGHTDKEDAEILKWMSFFNTDILIIMVEMYLPLVGMKPYDGQAVETYQKMVEAAVNVVEEDLQGKTFLVDQRLTLADLFCAGIISFGFQHIWGKDWREAHPNVTRWFTAIVEIPAYAESTERIELLAEPRLTNVAPNKRIDGVAPNKAA